MITQTSDMAQILPDELLVKIANACVEPYHIALTCRPDRPRINGRSDIAIRAGPRNGFLNVKLASKLFDDEVWAALQEKFIGLLQVDLGGWDIKELEEVAASVEELVAENAVNLSWLEPQIKKIV